LNSYVLGTNRKVFTIYNMKNEHWTVKEWTKLKRFYWWTRNYMRKLFQMFHIKIRKNLNFRFLLNKTELTSDLKRDLCTMHFLGKDCAFDGMIKIKFSFYFINCVKIDMLDMFNFYNENWNLCCIEYPSLRTKILIKKFLKKRQPNLSSFWTWDCLDYIWILDPKRVELKSRAYECVFIGYAINSETYRFMT